MTQSTGIAVDTCAQRYYIYLPYYYMSENKPKANETKGVYEINIKHQLYGFCMDPPGFEPATSCKAPSQ